MLCRLANMTPILRAGCFPENPILWVGRSRSAQIKRIRLLWFCKWLTRYRVSTLLIWTRLIRRAEHGKEESGSSSEMIMDETGLVSDDCFTEGWARRLVFLDYFQLSPAFRGRLIRINETKPSSGTRLTAVESSWNCSNSLNSDYTLSVYLKFMFPRTSLQHNLKIESSSQIHLICRWLVDICSRKVSMPLWSSKFRNIRIKKGPEIVWWSARGSKELQSTGISRTASCDKYRHGARVRSEDFCSIFSTRSFFENSHALGTYPSILADFRRSTFSDCYLAETSHEISFSDNFCIWKLASSWNHQSSW